MSCACRVQIALPCRSPRKTPPVLKGREPDDHCLWLRLAVTEHIPALCLHLRDASVLVRPASSSYGTH